MISSKRFSWVLLLTGSSCVPCGAFLACNGRGRACSRGPQGASLSALPSGGDSENYVFSSRRRLLQALAGTVPLLLLTEQNANAQDELFRKNPLTNPVLEQIRIWEQAEADNLRYGGELAPGDAGNRGKVDAYPKLLIPILEIASDLAEVNELVRDRDDSRWERAQRILSQGKYDKVPFKKIFNAYGDNIYYSDPDRANAYLGGGATPRSEQSLAYLLRNDILTNVEALRAELDYLLNDSTPATEKQDTADLLTYAQTATAAMQQYLQIVPPNELKAARDILAKA